MAWWSCRACKSAPIEGGNLEKPWIGPCPNCGHFADARRVEDAGDRQHNPLIAVTAASSADKKYSVKYIPTDVEPFDHCLSGGVALSQSLMLAGEPGSRKSSTIALALQGLTKHTTRYMLYVSAEQNTEGVMGRVFQINDVTSDRIVLHANDKYENSIQSILERCDELKPFACAFDSLQPISVLSGMSTEDVAEKITKYSGRTKMISFIISQLTKDGAFKGGTGSSYAVDTLCMFELFKPSVNGDPEKLFGKKIAREILHYSREMAAQDIIEGLRILVGGAFNKNRFGSSSQIRRVVR